MFLEKFKVSKSLETRIMRTTICIRYSSLSSELCLLCGIAPVKQKFHPATICPRFYCCLQELGSGHSCSHSPNDFFASLLPVLLSVERRGHLVILHLFKSVPINLLSFPDKCGAKQEDI